MKNSSNFKLNHSEYTVDYEYKLTPNLTVFRITLEDWISKHYDLNKVKKITALIYLNMAPLHPGDFGDLLFFRSKSLMREIYD